MNTLENKSIERLESEMYIRFLEEKVDKLEGDVRRLNGKVDNISKALHSLYGEVEIHDRKINKESNVIF